MKILYKYKMGKPRDERVFLKGRSSGIRETIRLLKILKDFVHGFRNLQNLGPAVTIFGSSRFPMEHRYCRLAESLAEKLAQKGFAIITGGGPGVMEAANKGAQTVKGHSIGINIDVPQEQAPNPYLDTYLNFEYFFARKVMLVKYSHAFIIFPGGFGTMDELFEALTLIQTQKVYNFPVVLMCKDFWQGLIDWMKKDFVGQGTIGMEDLDILKITDDADEAVNYILHEFHKFNERKE